MSPKPSVLEPLRVRIRRFQFIVGLGFISLVLGSALSVSLTLRLNLRVQALPFHSLKVLVAVLLENVWLVGVLPVLCYGAGRVMELKPWQTAAGAAVSGAVFVLALGYVQGGVDSLWLGGLGSVLNVAVFGAGIVVSARALKAGRAAAAQQSEKTQSKAEERKSEYDEFLRAAEQGGARLEQREAESAAGARVDTSAEAPGASASVETSSPGPGESAASAEGSVDTSIQNPVSSASGAEARVDPSVDGSSSSAEGRVDTSVSAVESLGAATASAVQAVPSEVERPDPVIRLPEQSLSEVPPATSDTSKTPAV
ncbi:hypothetical protein [Myxococcus llanfairpwllgwyngyllgogerychwyrndrobwllllantysiliogogogochensis]|uniref:hypothetical protein n=1 Tax=Myxococcus llanfairpwllgwyngyllgogerychwyrndrobwllllantysiliogogogochensis TaxID=2590453 RepID=UPI0015EFE6E5|nr:hypothetical protein [Myxococcus llanfairpwllgwyngyllgogerychwyrndrobwllllantysiliogogogochensis]